MRITSTLFITFCLLIAIAANASQPQSIDLFVSETEGYHTYRIPALIVTKKGTVLAFCEGRMKSRRDSGDIDLLLRRSVDGGKTWNPQQVVWDNGDTVCGNPCPVIDEKTGTIWLLMTWNLANDHERMIVKGTSVDTRRVFVTSSEDDGLTWSEPKDITRDVKKPNWSWYATGPGVGIQLKKGKHKGRMVIPCDHKRSGNEISYHSHVIYSDDGGKNWQLGGSTPNGANECQVIERKNGTLLLNMRRSREVKQTYRYVASSSDGGMTWEDFKLDKALIGPRCQASMIKAGKRVLFANPADKKARQRLTVRMSKNQGRTWPIAKALYPGPSAYNCLTQLPDGNIACLHEAGVKNPYEKIMLTTFSMEWLKK
jgi:sialidase-1